MIKVANALTVGQIRDRKGAALDRTLALGECYSTAKPPKEDYPDLPSNVAEAPAHEIASLMAQLRAWGDYYATEVARQEVVVAHMRDIAKGVRSAILQSMKTLGGVKSMEERKLMADADPDYNAAKEDVINAEYVLTMLQIRESSLRQNHQTLSRILSLLIAELENINAGSGRSSTPGAPSRSALMAAKAASASELAHRRGVIGGFGASVDADPDEPYTPD